MDSGQPKEEELISKSDLFLLRKQKVKKEIEAAKKLIKKKVDILEIADKFIHNMYELMKDGINIRNNSITEEDIKSKIREIIIFKEKLKSKKRRGNQLG